MTRRHQKAETKHVLEVKECLEKIPAVRAIWRNQTGCVQVKRGWMHLAPEGTPDLVGYLDTGTMLAVEVKQPGEGPTSAQIEWLTEARAHNVCAFVAVSGAEAIRLVLAFVRGDQLPEVAIVLAKSRKKKPVPFVRPSRQEALL